MDVDVVLSIYLLFFGAYLVVRPMGSFIRRLMNKRADNERDNLQPSISNVDKVLWILAILSFIQVTRENFFFQNLKLRELLAVYAIAHFFFLGINRRWIDRNIYEKFISVAGIISITVILSLQIIASFVKYYVDGHVHYAEYLYEKAKVELMDGDTVAAINYLDESILFDPLVPYVHIEKAWLQFNIGEYENAIKGYSEGIDLKPSNGTYFLMRADAKSANGDREGACADARVAEQLGEDIDISEYCD